MAKIRQTLLAAVSALMLVPAAASAETIFEAMAKAYQNNPDINAVRAALRATDENVTIAKAGYRPQISANAQASKIGISNIAGNPPGGDYDYETSSVGISITQQVFDGFQTLNRVRAAESGVYASRESLRANEIQILLSAVEAYANVARDQQIVGIRKQNLAFLREQLNAANARLQVGEGTRTDVSQAEAQLAAAEALLSAAVAQLKQSQAVYVQVVGNEPQGIKQPAPAKRALPASLDGAISSAVAEHPLVRASLHSVDAAGYQVSEAEGTLLPGVVIQGNIGRSTTTAPGSDFAGTSSSITAQLRVPIYQGGAEYGRVRQAKELLSEQQIRVDSVRNQVRQTVVSAFAQLEASRAATSAIGKQQSAAQMALEGVMEERNVGQATTLDVLNAQQSVLNAKESLANAARNAVVASYSLIAATGRLTVESQGLQVASYNPAPHYEAVKDAWFGLRTVEAE